MGKNEQKSPKADDPEMQDWRESISSVIAYEGTERADDILEEVVEWRRDPVRVEHRLHQHHLSQGRGSYSGRS